jgi:predicted outer membrane protein
MQKNKVLKRLLAVAAMFAAFGVHAQTSQSASDLSKQSATGNPNLSGKTTHDGTVDNTNSQGKDERSNAGQRGTSGSQGQSQSGAGMTGKTTVDGTAGNANSQGMGKDQMSGSSSGSGAMGGSTGTSGSGMGQGTAASGTAAGAMSKADQKILMDLAQANMAEIEAGKMALGKAQNDQVKKFAQQMVDDHTQALNDVQALAKSRNVTLPAETDAKHKAMAAKLDKMSGEAFEKSYMAQAGVADHKKVHSALMKDEKRAKDADLKALVGKMTPVVEQHLKSAEQMSMQKSAK